MVRRKQVDPPLSDEMLKVTIDELRRTNDWLNSAYDRVKVKTFTFLGGGFALLLYLYSPNGDVFFPKEFYGQIFYVIGLALLVSAMVMLFFSLLPRMWIFSIDREDLSDMNFVDDNHYLQYVKNNQLKAYEQNSRTYAKNHRVLALSFYPLIIGAIILVVLKMFGT